MITAENDPLRSGGQILAARIKAAGGKVDSKNYDGVTHEFFGMSAVLQESRDATQFAGNNLRKAFKHSAARRAQPNKQEKL